jgi:1,4-dihydroxy-6-naphthoate synthase
LQQLNHLIHESILYAQKNYPVLPGFVTRHAQAMETAVMIKHIDLYVNEYSLLLGEQGKSSVYFLLEMFNKDLPPRDEIFI